MAKTNNEGQDRRRKNGDEHQNHVHSYLETWLERTGLDSSFVVENKGKKYFVACGGNRKSKPDLVFKSTATGSPVAAVGCKASLKDRRGQDYWSAEGWKMRYPGTLWFEVLRSEDPLETNPEKIERGYDNHKLESAGMWDFVASTMVLKMMERLTDGLEAYLRAVMSQEKQTAKDTPADMAAMAQSA